nr:MAG TPA: hypothetical protein [Caudoviricetes sp.]DAW90780.1 MAG TPA: hypothetical protein [Bacteriophage sp.]
MLGSIILYRKIMRFSDVSMESLRLYEPKY